MNDTTNPPLKKCSKCGIEYPATAEYFSRDKSTKDGLRHNCKTCRNAMCKIYREQNPDRYAEYKRRTLSNPMHQETARLARRRYYIEHAEELNQRSRKYYQEHAEELRFKQRMRNRANPEKLSSYNRSRIRDAERENYLRREYYKKNTQKVKMWSRLARHKRQSIQRNINYHFAKADWERCLEYFNHTCAVCGRPRGLWHTLAQDHWIAVNSKDCPGTIATNIVPLCHGIGGCNNMKLDREPASWLIERYGKRKANQILKRIQAYFEWVKQQ